MKASSGRGDDAEGEPEGVELLGVTFGFQPGQEAKVALSPGLDAGRYAFVCFLPDTSQEQSGRSSNHTRSLA